jgi:hypothetical protein
VESPPGRASDGSPPRSCQRSLAPTEREPDNDHRCQQLAEIIALTGSAASGAHRRIVVDRTSSTSQPTTMPGCSIRGGAATPRVLARLPLADRTSHDVGVSYPRENESEPRPAHGRAPPIRQKEGLPSGREPHRC